MKRILGVLFALIMMVCLIPIAQAATASSITYPATIIAPVNASDAVNGGISYAHGELNDWGYNIDLSIYPSDIEDIWIRYFKESLSHAKYRAGYVHNGPYYQDDVVYCSYELSGNPGELKLDYYYHQMYNVSGYSIVAYYNASNTLLGIQIKSNEKRIVKANGSMYNVSVEEYQIKYTEKAHVYAPGINQWYKSDPETECPKILYNAVSENVIPKISTPGPVNVSGTLRLGDPYPTQFDPNVSGLLWDSDGGYMVSLGRVDTSVNGLVQDPNNPNDWYYLALGQVQSQYSGLAEYDGEWFYLENGKLNTTRAGLVGYDGGRFMIAAGRILREVNGLIQEPNTKEWYYCAAGQVADYTGLALYDGAWFYVNNGMLDESFTGDVEYDGAMFHVVNGMMVQ